MTKFELARELRGKYHLEVLQQMELVVLPDGDLTQEQIEYVWESSDAHYLLLVDDEDCEAVYNKLLA